MSGVPANGDPVELEPRLLMRLVAESLAFDDTHADPQRNCWLVVHRHVHGVLPSEYDIREIPEELYLAVLAERMKGQASTDQTN
ncbi:MAG: hypothetical protein ACK5N0_13010 [Synechococcaceae cyanobacterium]